MRTSAHKLEIETGRYTKTKREERHCKLCTLAVENELHFIMSCPKLSKRRTTFDKIIINTISEWNDLNNLTKCLIINPPEKIAVTSAQFCHELLLLRNKILPRASTSRNRPLTLIIVILPNIVVIVLYVCIHVLNIFFDLLG